MRDIVKVVEAILKEVPSEAGALRAELLKVQACGANMPEELKFKAWEMLDEILQDYNCSVEQHWKTNIRSLLTGTTPI